jgi:hypothetical protein
MCSPTVIPYVIMAVGTAYGMYAENKAAHYQAAVDVQNSKLADQEAKNANAQGSYAADQARIRGNLARGSQMAAFAANGVDMTTGSAADILGDTAMFTAQDERQARTNAALQSYGFQVQSLADKGAAAYSLYSGKSQEFGTFLQGAGMAAGYASSSGAFAKKPATASFNGGGNTLLTGGTYKGPNSLSISYAGSP